MARVELEPFALRTYRFIGTLALLGTVVALLRWGGAAGLGFALGSAFSALNFRLWHGTVRRVGGPKSPLTAMVGMRYIVFVLLGYAILKYFEANVLAALAGCFVAVTAVVLEVLLELIYGT